MADIKVGDKVAVFDGGRAHQGQVVRVGRTLIDIKYRNGTHTFHIDTRKMKGQQYGYGVYFMSPEEAEAKERLAAAEKVLQEHRITLEFGHTLTNDQVEALAALVRNFT